MNLLKIRQLASEGDLSVKTLRYLLDCHCECEHLDYKSALDLDNDYGCACIGKDALAIKNVGGGYIVVGVEDKTWRPLGLTKDLPYDTKTFRDKIRKSTGLDLEVDLINHSQEIDGDEKTFAMILIRAATKQSKLRVPSICKVSFHPNEKWGIRQGDIYIRDGDQTKRLDDEYQLLNLLEELETRYQEDELKRSTSIPSPFAVESGLFRLLPREYETFVGRDEVKINLRDAIEKDPRLWIINLHGPGGVGKSALATWLAYDCYHEKRYEAILHLSAKDLELSSEGGIRHLRPTLISLEDFLDRVLHLFEHGEFCESELLVRKNVVIEILTAYNTLLVLDNMETVGDGRIMQFIRELPPDSRTKVLLTSRRRSSAWEYPIQVTEFNVPEIKEFLEVRTKEMQINFPYNDQRIVEKISEISGGLPLAIQWTLGEFANSKNLDKILNRAVDKDSPLLEFSFRNSWNSLEEFAKQALAVLTIFDSPPSLQEWRTALDWSIDKLEKVINQLIEVTFITERTGSRTGIISYQALPITLMFARNELSKFGDLERIARQNYQSYRDRFELASVESYEYDYLFKRFEARTEIQKRAIILSRMAEGQARSFGYEEAKEYYNQALEIDPTNVYALVSYALFLMELQIYGESLELMDRASKRVTKKTGFYVYFNLAKIYDQIKDRTNRVQYLRKALKYEPNNVVARHSLGVALGRVGNHEEAIEIFDEIIIEELNKQGRPSDSLEIALRTKVISLKRMKEYSKADEAIDEVVENLIIHEKPNDVVSKIEKMRSEDI